jgi:tetratricopeptide (TPR) repeat protein
MVSDFPDSPMGHFSLGKYLLEEKRWRESVAALERAVSIDPAYSAAWVALGDAWAGSGDSDRARAAWQRALETPHGKKDQTLQADLEHRMSEL